jgi:hypothetical protein
MVIFIQEISAANRQNHLCKKCGRQFVEHSSQILVSEAQKSLVDKLLLEKISLAGIARVLEVSEGWLGEHISDLYASCPDHLCVDLLTAASMSEHLADKFDKYVYEIAGLKKTLFHLSLQHHGKILAHLRQI